LASARSCRSVLRKAATASGPIPLVVTSLGFALGWFMLGINAVRLDRPASEARPA
jgi:hypothetical protein